MVAIKDADFSDVDAVFCCLPHGTTQVCKFVYCYYVFTLNSSYILLNLLIQYYLRLCCTTCGALDFNKLYSALPNYNIFFIRKLSKVYPDT